jgi:hypothetical protein
MFSTEISTSVENPQYEGPHLDGKRFVDVDRTRGVI